MESDDLKDFDDFGEFEEPEYTNFYDAKVAIVEAELRPDESHGSEARKRRASPSQTRNLLHAVLDASAEYAHSKGMQPNSLDHVASDGIMIVWNLQSSVHDWSVASADPELDFWQHSGLTIRQLKEKGAPHIDREVVAQSVEDYLKLPYRVQQLDRLLADMVVGMEFHAFASEVLHEEGSAAFPFGSPIKQRHAIIAYLRRIGFSVIALGGLAALASKLIDSDVLTASIIALLVVVCLGLTVILPFHWWNQRKWRKKIWEMISLMQRTYFELNTAGPISARRLREVAARAADAGANWGPLFALLDDNIARSGRL